jgi:hypothetical protein
MPEKKWLARVRLRSRGHGPLVIELREDMESAFGTSARFLVVLGFKSPRRR